MCKDELEFACQNLIRHGKDKAVRNHPDKQSDGASNDSLVVRALQKSWQSQSKYVMALVYFRFRIYQWRQPHAFGQLVNKEDSSKGN